MLVREFYEAYDKAIPKNKSKVKSLVKPLDIVDARGVKMPYSQIKMNDILGCMHKDIKDMEEKIKV